jgi:hypothetical protein
MQLGLVIVAGVVDPYAVGGDLRPRQTADPRQMLVPSFIAHMDLALQLPILVDFVFSVLQQCLKLLFRSWLKLKVGVVIVPKAVVGDMHVRHRADHTTLRRQRVLHNPFAHSRLRSQL